MYASVFKRWIDFALALGALIVLSPVLLILIILGAVAMGGNPFFVQPRPGKKDKNGQEKIFNLIKFRTMSNKKDAEGNLLPDEVRLNKYGRILRSTSLDELPELINILKGDMALVGPRPQLVRDMVFMSKEQRRRHDVRPGLTGWAQVNGRNAISWENKLAYDLEYIKRITFWGDIKILWLTVVSVLKKDGISAEGMDTAEDFGEYLLRTGCITRDVYERKQGEARELIKI